VLAALYRKTPLYLPIFLVTPVRVVEPLWIISNNLYQPRILPEAKIFKTSLPVADYSRK